VNKLSICVPCRDHVNAEFAYCLSELTSELTRQGISYVLRMRKGSMLPEQRAHLAAEALEAKSDHILWLDSDMTFPNDIYNLLLKMLSHVLTQPKTKYRDQLLFVKQMVLLKEFPKHMVKQLKLMQLAWALC
jgi:hypothetical protein